MQVQVLVRILCALRTAPMRAAYEATLLSSILHEAHAQSLRTLVELENMPIDAASPVGTCPLVLNNGKYTVARSCLAATTAKTHPMSFLRCSVQQKSHSKLYEVVPRGAHFVRLRSAV